MTVNDQLSTDTPRDPWAAHADEPTRATEIVAAPEKSGTADVTDRAGKTDETASPEPEKTGIMGRAEADGPPATPGKTPPGKPKRSPRTVLIAAVLVTAIASSGITAGIMSAIGGGSAPAATTQDGTPGQQGGPGGFGGGMRGGGGMPGGGQQDSGTTQQDPGTTQQDSGTAQQDPGAAQQDATGT
ncbi:hypothetical protein [Actinoplanes sp. CA-252034]|uniref:hypothetical protein n=1 Tax=Actinoplanes sp. CA-252034 TaxID=3239906 RepID=UPI003D99FBE7